MIAKILSFIRLGHQKDDKNADILLIFQQQLALHKMCGRVTTDDDPSEGSPLLSSNESSGEDDEKRAPSFSLPLGVRLFIWSVPLLLLQFGSIWFVSLFSTFMARSTSTTIEKTECDSFQSSLTAVAYDNDENEDYFPCSPQKVHLSQASDVIVSPENEKGENIVNFTVSFSISSREPKCKNAKPFLIYGMRKENNDNRNNGLPNNPDHKDTIEGIVTKSEIIHFDYISTPNNQEHYSSDWIHHMTIPNIQAGVEKYWYRVFMLLPTNETTTHKLPSNNTLFDLDDYRPLLVKQLLLSHFPSSFSCSWNPVLKSSPSSLRGTLAREAVRDMCENRLVFINTRRSLHKIDVAVVVVGQTPSPYYTFWTTPTYGQPTSLALVGDLGQTKYSAETIHDIYLATTAANTTFKAHNAISGGDNSDKKDEVSSIPIVSALLVAGDMSYADGDPHRWDSWFELMVSAL